MYGSCEAMFSKREKRDKQIDIEAGSAGQKRKLIISLTWPALAENVFMSTISMVAMIMVGDLGSYAISAVGLITQPRFLLMAAFIAMNTGTTALVAQYKGAGNNEGANSVLNQALILSLALAVTICTAMLIFAKPLLNMMAGGGLSDQIVSEALVYFRIQIYGFPIQTFTFAINAALRGAGKTKETFYNNAVANIVNVAMNFCLIYGRFGFPRLEVAGASYAGVIGQCVAFIMALSIVVRGKHYLHLKFRNLLKIDWSMIKRIMNIGIPSLFEQIIMRVGSIWFTTIVTALGDVAYAAHMVGMNIEMLAFSVGMAFGTAATTLMGQCIGRKRIDLAKIYIRMTQRLGLIVSLVITFVLFFFGATITGWYSKEMMIIALSADMLKIYAVINPIVNARTIYISGLRGAGDAKFMAVISFVGVIVVRPLFAIVLVNVFEMGLTGIWLALGADFLISHVLAVFRYRREKWTRLNIL